MVSNSEGSKYILAYYIDALILHFPLIEDRSLFYRGCFIIIYTVGGVDHFYLGSRIWDFTFIRDQELTIVEY